MLGRADGRDVDEGRVADEVHGLGVLARAAGVLAADVRLVDGPGLVGPERPLERRELVPVEDRRRVLLEAEGGPLLLGRVLEGRLDGRGGFLKLDQEGNYEHFAHALLPYLDLHG
jgi:hypothetical protein